MRRGGVDAGLTIESDRSEGEPIQATEAVDPTGCGDAYRAGLLYGIANDLSLETATKLGSLMGALKVAHSGPQSIALDLEGIRGAYSEHYGERF